MSASASASAAPQSGPPAQPKSNFKAPPAHLQAKAPPAHLPVPLTVRRFEPAGGASPAATMPFGDIRLKEAQQGEHHVGQQDGQGGAKFAPRQRDLVGPQPGTSDNFVAWDVNRIGEEPQLPQGDLGDRARWKAPVAEGTSTGKKKRTIQLILEAGTPYGDYYKWFLKATVYIALTHNWHLIQGAARCGQKAKQYVKNLFDLLELDWHSQWALVSLHASGLPGATHFAHVMWSLLKKMACKEPYEDLSHWVTNLIKLTRTRFDQPPEGHHDQQTWGWSKMEVPHDWRWCPLAVPQEVIDEDVNWTIQVAPDGEPLKPPACWPSQIRVAPHRPPGLTWCEGPRDWDMRQGPHPRQWQFRKLLEKTTGGDDEDSSDDEQQDGRASVRGASSAFTWA